MFIFENVFLMLNTKQLFQKKMHFFYPLDFEKKLLLIAKP